MGWERYRDGLIDDASLGFGGSALGPQFVLAGALGGSRGDRMSLHFLDNTDPDGIDRVLDELGDPGIDPDDRDLQVGRHGRNAQRDARGEAPPTRFAGWDFRPARRGDHRARQQARPLRRGARIFSPFPDVGLGRRPHLGNRRGRSAAGRTPGIDIDGCSTARPHGRADPRRDAAANPAALLALAWHHAGDGRGARTWSSCRTRIAWPCSAATCSNS